MADWLSEIKEGIQDSRDRGLYVGKYEDFLLMNRVLREQSKVLKATNPWEPCIAITNGYKCRHCRVFVRFTCAPKSMEFMKGHNKSCVWRNLSDDAKELLDD